MRQIIAAVAVLLISQPAFAVQLFGGLEHKDVLPDNADQLRAAVEQTQPVLQSQSPTLGVVAPLVGQAQSQSPLLGGATLQRPELDWFMIPVWMAGRWHKRGDLTLSVTDLVTGRTGMPNIWTDNDMSVRWGHQVDKAGNIWHANFIPTRKDGSSGGSTVRFLTVARSCEKTTPQLLMTRTRYIVTNTADYTHEVLESYQQESLNSYAITVSGELVNESSNKMFHMNGQPFRIGTLDSRFTKVQPFIPEKFDRGIDMQAALAAYLHSQNLDHLIPEAVTADSQTPGLAQ